MWSDCQKGQWVGRQRHHDESSLSAFHAARTQKGCGRSKDATLVTHYQAPATNNRYAKIRSQKSTITKNVHLKKRQNSYQ